MHGNLPLHLDSDLSLVAQRQPIAFPNVRRPVESTTSKRLHRHISQEVCPWNVKFSLALADDSPFRAREFIAGKDAVTLAREILTLEQEQFRAAFRKSPMKRAKLAGLRRNAAVVIGNMRSSEARAPEE
jgi:epoxyqueuosine reductase